MLITRRLTLGASASVSLAAAMLRTRRPADAQTATPQTAPPAAPSGPFTLPPLPYAADANEPAIDAQTMLLHHDKHHAAYVNNLNAALKDHPELAARALPDLLAHLADVPETVRTAVRNNAGGHANHSMFWTILGGPNVKTGGGAPDGELAAAIDRDLGGFDTMKAAFQKAGLSVFGSGWVFVTVTPEGKLALLTRPNQDTPLLEGGRVLFGNDVWEHAYYLKYHNVRGDYLKAWWSVVNWPEIAARYGRAKAGTLGV